MITDPVSELEESIKRYDIQVKVNGEWKKFQQVAIRREKKKNHYQLLTKDYELIDLYDVDLIFNETRFLQQWENLIFRGTL